MNYKEIFNQFLREFKAKWEHDELMKTEICDEIDKLKVVQMMIIGHSYHCAYRQVYGDGECECDLYAKGYDPYAWLKKRKENPCSKETHDISEPEQG